ncbi:MAG: hypothetical protein H0T60_14660 [Acidobacteria bacterium]|nr:hypothetical protein [Acidobacteriota bacterium]
MNLTSIVFTIVVVIASFTQPTASSPAAVQTVGPLPADLRNEDIPETCSAPCVVDAQGNVIFCPC